MRYTELFEGSIVVADIDALARAQMRDSISQYCKGEWELIKSRHPEVDTNNGENRTRMYDAWYEQDFSSRSQRLSFSKGLAYHISRDLTKMVKEYGSKQQAHVPPRLRKETDIRVLIDVKDDSTDAYASKYGGYYESGAKLIKVFVDSDVLESSGLNALHDCIFGDSEGVDDLINKILPTFIHEYTHSEQFRRGLEGRSTRGYISKGGMKKNPFMGDHHSPQAGAVGGMRYTGAAHEIEAFAAGAAAQLTYNLYDQWSKDTKIDNDKIEGLCQDIAQCYVDANQMSRYLWLRQYRDHYVELGFKGHELENTFKRFMKILYRKLQDYRKNRVGKARIDPTAYPAAWIKYAKLGLDKTIREISHDIAFDIVDGKQVYDTISKASVFVSGYFFKDEHDWSKQEKVGNLIRRLSQQIANQSTQSP